MSHVSVCLVGFLRRFGCLPFELRLYPHISLGDQTLIRDMFTGLTRSPPYVSLKSARQSLDTGQYSVATCIVILWTRFTEYLASVNLNDL